MVDIVNDRWLGLSDQGESLGPITLDEAADGALHASSHVWIWRIGANGIEVLVQRRSANETWPGYLDVSAAGHVDYGDDPIVTALKEAEEEIGIQLDRDELFLVAVYRINVDTAVGDKKIIENELQWIYAAQWRDDWRIVLADGEVDDTLWLGLQEFRDVIGGHHDDMIVNHGNAYYSMLIENIERLAKQ